MYTYVYVQHFVLAIITFQSRGTAALFGFGRFELKPAYDDLRFSVSVEKKTNNPSPENFPKSEKFPVVFCGRFLRNMVT